jgi:hypothetical protein
VRLNSHLFHLIAFLLMYFSIKQCLNILYNPINVQYNMPTTIGFFLQEQINHFLFISYGKNLFGICPVWYKSKDLERIKDVYRGTTVSACFV